MTDLLPGNGRGRTLTAFFDTRAAADKAVADLEAAGISRQQIHRVDGATPGTTTSGEATTARGTGFLASLKDMFMPEEDRYGYAEGLGRGGFLVTVSTDGADYARVTDILDRDGAVDMDEREASWRKEGWTGYTATPAASVPAPAGALGTMAATGASATARTNTPGTTAMIDAPAPVMPIGRTAGVAGAAAGAALGSGGRRVETAAEARGAAGGVEYIPIVEEKLNVAKRDVSHGRVRLRSYVIETPVEEQVSLHGETVQVDRRRVDRPVTAADEALFTEKTIELEEFAEEAVVSKEARVVEEIALRRDASDRTETIRDTVRRTDVKVEDERGGVVGTATGAARSLDGIRDGMDVVGSDGVHVGTVDHLDGGRIKLTKADAASGGEHHYLAPDLVRSVSGEVVLAVTAAEARTRWTTA